MTIRDAILDALAGSGGAWLRPVEWSGSGKVLCINDSYVSEHPSGQKHPLSIMDLLGEWEVVTAEQFTSEVKGQ